MAADEAAADQAIEGAARGGGWEEGDLGPRIQHLDAHETRQVP